VDEHGLSYGDRPRHVRAVHPGAVDQNGGFGKWSVAPVRFPEQADIGIGGGGARPGGGIRGMVDRIEALGGELTVETSTARGTSVRATVPCG